MRRPQPSLRLWTRRPHHTQREATQSNDSVIVHVNDRGLSSHQLQIVIRHYGSPNDNDCIQFVSEHDAPVHIARALLSIVNEVANIRDSEPGSIVSWAREAQGPMAMNHAIQSLYSMSGGLPDDKLCKKSIDDLRPEDLGV